MLKALHFVIANLLVPFLGALDDILSFLHLFVALLPLDVHDLGELEIGRVGGEQTGSLAVAGLEADLGVDVEHTGGTAWRPDDGGRVSLVVLEVIAVGGALELVGGGGLG